MSLAVPERSRSAVARSMVPARWPVTVAGALLASAGIAVAFVGLGLFGENRAQRPLLDPLAVEAVATHPTVARIVAIAVGSLLLVLGGVWALRVFHPDRSPRLRTVEVWPGRPLDARAAAAAIAADAQALPGVAHAAARLVVAGEEPALRLTLRLDDDADAAAVWRDLPAVLAGAGRVLGVESLPAAVQLTVGSARRAS